MEVRHGRRGVTETVRAHFQSASSTYIVLSSTYIDLYLLFSGLKRGKAARSDCFSVLGSSKAWIMRQCDGRTLVATLAGKRAALQEGRDSGWVQVHSIADLWAG